MTTEALIVHHFVESGNVHGLRDIPTMWFRAPWRSIVETIRELPVLTMETALDALKNGTAGTFEIEMKEAAGYRKTHRKFQLETHISALRLYYARLYVLHLVDLAVQAKESGQEPLKIASEIGMRLVKASYVGKEVKATWELLGDVEQAPNVAIGFDLPGFFQAGFRHLNVGNMGVLGGPSGSFKTTFALDFLKRIVRQNDNVIGLYFQAEQPKREMIYKLVCSLSDATYDEVQSQYNVDFPQFCAEVRAQLVPHKSFLDRIKVFDSTDFRTARDIVDLVVTNKVEGKYIFFVVDYISRLKLEGGEGTNAGIVSALNELKDVCVSTDSYCLCVSQLVKTWNLDHARRPIAKMPLRDDLMWSSELTNLSANTIMVLRPSLIDRKARESANGRALLLVGIDKIRHQDFDGLVPMKLNGQSQYMMLPDPEDMVYFGKFNEMLTKRKFIEEF